VLDAARVADDLLAVGVGERVVGHHKIKKLLTDAGLDEATAERDVNALHAGGVLVLVKVPEGEAERVTALLGG
jgi:hypothetical protein